MLSIGASFGLVFMFWLWPVCVFGWWIVFAGGIAASRFEANLRGDLAFVLLQIPLSVVVFGLALLVANKVGDWRTVRIVESSVPAVLLEADRDCMPGELLRLSGRGSFPRPGFVIVDCGPPVRVAFQFGTGLLDNWSGLVYDPSAGVSAIPDPGDLSIQSRPHRLRGLFGGDIVRCRPLRNKIFDCSFT